MADPVSPAGVSAKTEKGGWRIPDPDPIQLTYPESLLVFGRMEREVRYRRRRLQDGEGDPVREQRKLDRALNVIDKLNAASHHPKAVQSRV